MKGYAVLTVTKNLKFLCFRGGFSIKKIIISHENISGKTIIHHIKKELCISNIQLGIDVNKRYNVYELEVKTLPEYLNNFFNIFRHFIRDVLITY